MTDITDIPLDVLLQHILGDPDLSPSDILGICGKPGFVMLCRLKKVGNFLMRRYYPNVFITDDPWRQFKMLASDETIVYQTSITDDDIELTIGNGPNLPINTLSRLYDTGLSMYKNQIRVEVKGVPITGKHWIGGTVGVLSSNMYQIYPDKEQAILAMWEKLQEMIAEDTNPDRKISRRGQVDYSSPVDYRETFDRFREDMLQRGYSLYEYYRIVEHYEYGDFDQEGTVILSIHNPEFVN